MVTPLKLLLITSSLMNMITAVTADYQIGWTFRNYSQPTNTLASGDCCEVNCTACSPVLRFCFRESGHSREDKDTCSLQMVIRNNAMIFSILSSNAQISSALYTGSFQLYIRVAHDGAQSPSYDQSDPLIDEVFFEFTGVQLMMSDILSQTGDFDRVTIEVSVITACANGFNGTDCNIFCENIEGILSCREIIENIAQTTRGDEATTTLIMSTSTGQGSNSSPTVPSNQSSDNTVAIAVGVTIALIVVLLLVIAVIIVAIYLNRRCNGGPTTAFYTVKRAGSLASASSRLSNRIDNNAQLENQPVNSEDIYSTIDKKTKKAPALPPPYNPDDVADPEYHNVNSGQGRAEEVAYANATAIGIKTGSLKYAEVVPSTLNSHHIEPDRMSNDDGVSYSELQQQ